MRYNPLLHGHPGRWDSERKPAKGKGGGGSSQQTVQNFSPEEAKRRTEIMDAAKGIYEQTAAKISSSPYPGSQVVPFSPETQAAQQFGANFAYDFLPGANQQLWDSTIFGLTDAMDVNTNPYLQSAIGAAVRPITQDYLDPGGVFSQLRTEGINNGGYGTSSRDAMAQGIAAGRYANAIGDVGAKMASEGYQQGLDTYAKTLALTPQTLQTMQMPMSLLSGIGAQRENLQQMGEDYNAQSRLWDLNAEWTPLQNWANIVFGAGSGQSTATTQTPSSRNPIGGAIGGAMTGYSLGPMLGMTGPVGAIGGAILGGLFG